MNLGKNVLKVLLMFIGLSFASCDPAKILVIQNKTGQEIKLFIPKEYQRTVSRWDTASVFILKPMPHTTKYYHGLGGWSKDEEENIRKIFSEHCSLSIQDNILYKKTIAAKRKGLAKSNLLIAIQ